MVPLPFSNLPFKKRPVSKQPPKSGRWSGTLPKRTVHPNKSQSTAGTLVLPSPNKFKSPPAKLGEKRIEENEQLTRNRRRRPLEWLRSSALGRGFRTKLPPKFNLRLAQR